MQTKKINLYGASGHSKVIIDIIGERPEFEMGYLFDDNEKLVSLLDYPILSPQEKEKLNANPLIFAIGNNSIRKKVAEANEANLSDFLAHPSTIISTSAFIDKGTVAMANAVVNASSVIGKNVILNTSSVVEHDCVIEDYVHISPKAALAGDVHVGEGTHIGIGAVVIQGVRIGEWCTIGAGAVIIRDVPSFSTVVGNPGKVIKTKKF